MISFLLFISFITSSVVICVYLGINGLISDINLSSLGVSPFCTCGIRGLISAKSSSIVGVIPSFPFSAFGISGLISAISCSSVGVSPSK